MALPCVKQIETGPRLVLAHHMGGVLNTAIRAAYSCVRSLPLSDLGRVCVCDVEGAADLPRYLSAWAWGSRGTMGQLLLHVSVTRPKKETLS